MKSLSGWIYLIVGLTFVIVSYSTNEKKLMFFIFVGIIMLVIGIIKIFFEIFMKSNLERKSKHTAHKIKPNNKKSSSIELSYKICPNCGIKVHKSFKFCPNCGYRLL